MIAPARIAAYETVLAVAAGRADLPSALARTRTRLQDERDRALAGEIATGTLRWQAAFDHIVEQFSGRPSAKLDAEILAILRISIFQLLYLDRVPASAVVDDAVEMARKAGKKSASGFVNALLRRVSRERTALPPPQETADRVVCRSRCRIRAGLPSAGSPATDARPPRHGRGSITPPRRSHSAPTLCERRATR